MENLLLFCVLMLTPTPGPRPDARSRPLGNRAAQAVDKHMSAQNWIHAIDTLVCKTIASPPPFCHHCRSAEVGDWWLSAGNHSLFQLLPHHQIRPTVDAFRICLRLRTRGDTHFESVCKQEQMIKCAAHHKITWREKWILKGKESTPSHPVHVICKLFINLPHPMCFFVDGSHQQRINGLGCVSGGQGAREAGEDRGRQASLSVQPTNSNIAVAYLAVTVFLEAGLRMRWEIGYVIRQILQWNNLQPWEECTGYFIPPACEAYNDSIEIRLLCLKLMFPVVYEVLCWLANGDL